MAFQLPNFGDTGGPVFQQGGGDVFNVPSQLPVVTTPAVSNGSGFSSIIQDGFGSLLQSGIDRLTESVQTTSREDAVIAALKADKRQRRQARQQAAAASPLTMKNVLIGVGVILAAVVGVTALVR